MVAGSGLNRVEGVWVYIGLAYGLDLGRVMDGTTANTSAQRMTEILSLANRKRHDAAVTATMALFMVLQSEDSCFSLSAAPLMPSAVTQNRLAISSAC